MRKSLAPILYPGAVLLIVFAIYFFTLAPSLTWAHFGADGGDLITAVALNRLPHPPGYPVYLTVAPVFLQIPWGDPAWRLNLMSAVFTALASGLLAATARRALNLSILGSICAGICFGGAPAVWSQAVIAEVYALAIFFAVTLLYLIVSDAPIWVIGLVWGVALGAHPMLVLFAPMLFWRARSIHHLILAMLSAVIGWDVVYGPILLLRANAPSPWGDVTTLDGWWAFVSAQIYHGYFFSITPDALPQKIFSTLATFTQQFTFVGAAIALIGWLILWRQQRARAIVSLLTVGAIAAFALAYGTVDSIVYLIFAVPLGALWLAVGLSAMERRWRWSRTLILILPLMQIGFFWNEMDLRADRTALEWATQALTSAPPRALLATAEDRTTFALWYAHDVLRMRADVIVVDRDLWQSPPYRQMISASSDANISLDDFARATQRPLIDAR